MTGRKVQTRWFVYHPFSYGIATLARVGVRIGGHQLLLHLFKPQEPAHKFHDHPWPFTTLVVWGGYIDEALIPGRNPITLVADNTPIIVQDKMHVGSIRRRSARHCHRMQVKRWTVTLVHTRPRERNWCEGNPGAWECDGDADDFDQTLGMHPAQVS